MRSKHLSGGLVRYIVIVVKSDGNNSTLPFDLS